MIGTIRRTVTEGEQRGAHVPALRGVLMVVLTTLALACASARTRPTAVTSTVAPPPPVPVVRVNTQRLALRTLIDTLVGNPRFRNAIWGILIVDPAHRDTLYSLNAQKLFVPASNMKIVTGAVALATLGPDYRFRTTFAIHGRVKKGVLHGDLVVIGRGDPTVSDHMMHDAELALRVAADSLSAHGIHGITGHLLAGNDVFPDAKWGAGWEWDDLAEPYAAGVDALMFNEGLATVIVRGAARSGEAAHVTSAPIAGYPVLRSHVVTENPIGGASLTPVTATYDAASGDLVVAGAIAPRDSVTVDVAYRDPATAYLNALAQAFTSRGIRVRRDAVDDGGLPESAALDTIFTLNSPPLRDILPALEKPSQNQIAEILLKTVGLERTGVGSADSGRRVEETQLASWGADTDGYVIRDGSGLSRHDYLSPATLVRVLDAITRDTAFATFYDALPVAGVDGTISDRLRGTAAANNAHAKTGYVDRVRSLSGYVTTTDGTRLIFSLLCNNWTVSIHDVEGVQDGIVGQLAALSLRRAAH